MTKDHSKKRKRDPPTTQQNGDHQTPSMTVDTSKPTAVFHPSQGRSHTLSVAIPGSIIANAQTHDLKTHLAGTIARALAVFCVDEIIIFEDGPIDTSSRQTTSSYHAAQDEASGYTAFSDPSDFLYHVLNYLETPPYLRKSLFGFHPNLRTAGALMSLDMPHHLKAEEWCQYREGVTVESDVMGRGFSNGEEHGGKKQKKGKKNNDDTTSTYTVVNAGIPNPIHIPASIPPNTRVTLRFDSAEPPNDTYRMLTAIPVAPDAPREDAGYYWGFTTRRAASLSAVITESPFESGYDYIIGTSERGEGLQQFLQSHTQRRSDATDGSEEGSESDSDDEDTPATPTKPSWKHPLLIFGGVAGLEKAFQHDHALRETGVTEVSQVFDAWVNLVPGQGSRTIRTEEAVWCGLMGLSSLWAT